MNVGCCKGVVAKGGDEHRKYDDDNRGNERKESANLCHKTANTS